MMETFKDLTNERLIIMEMKKTARERFLDSYLDVKEDWDKYVAEKTGDEEMLAIQERFGNKTNYDLGREMWYSNDFFINSRILDFITSNEENDELTNELKNVYVGIRNIPGFIAEAKNTIEEFDGYLIVMNEMVDLQVTLMSYLAGSYLYFLHPNISVKESRDLIAEMEDNLLYLVDKDAWLEVSKEKVEEITKVDVNNITHKQHIETDLLVAGMDFIIGHEFGHHILKHTDVNEKSIVSKFMPTDITSNQLHLDEFAADNFGLELVISSMKKRKRNTLFGPLMVILMLALGDKEPEKPSDTHPSFKDRYLNLLSKLTEYDEELALKLQKIFEDLAAWIYDDELFSKKKGYWDTEWWK